MSMLISNYERLKAFQAIAAHYPLSIQKQVEELEEEMTRLLPRNKVDVSHITHSNKKTSTQWHMIQDAPNHYSLYEQPEISKSSLIMLTPKQLVHLRQQNETFAWVGLSGIVFNVSPNVSKLASISPTLTVNEEVSELNRTQHRQVLAQLVREYELMGFLQKQPMTSLRDTLDDLIAQYQVVVPDKTFTKDELATYTGQDGSKAYVAVSGLVFDVGAISGFVGGKHHGMRAGRDLSDQFNVCHTDELNTLFEKATVVGRLAPARHESSFFSKHYHPYVERKPKSLRESTNELLKKYNIPTPTQTFTKDELATYTGQDGSKAYVAVSGLVFDVGAISGFVGGKHHGMKAGRDLSDQFNVCHADELDSLFEKAKVIGLLT